MPKPMRSRPRAPIEAYGRTSAGASGARPRFSRMLFSAAARSGAVSASVPSKSKRTARKLEHAAHQVVHIGIRPEAVLPRERVVGHAQHLFRTQPGLAREARQLRGLDEAQVVVRAA